LNAIIVLSTDGGKNFQPLASFPAKDQPAIAVGAGSVWITFNNGDVEAAGAPVTGRGAIGNFTPVEAAPGSQSATFSGNFGDIAIGPHGEVLVTYQNQLTNQGPDDIFVSRDPDGLGPQGFDTPVLVTSTQVGGHQSIPAQAQRRIDAEASLAWDRSGG